MGLGGPRTSGFNIYIIYIQRLAGPLTGKELAILCLLPAPSYNLPPLYMPAVHQDATAASSSYSKQTAFDDHVTPGIYLFAFKAVKHSTQPCRGTLHPRSRRV